MRQAPIRFRLTKMDEISGWILILFAFGIFLLTSKAEALREDWKHLSSNDKGESVFYDSASILQTAPDVITLWTRELTREAPMRKLEEINCKYKIIRDKQVIVEGAGKAPSMKVRVSEWRDMDKQPALKALYKAVCR